MYRLTVRFDDTDEVVNVVDQLLDEGIDEERMRVQLAVTGDK